LADGGYKAAHNTRGLPNGQLSKILLHQPEDTHGDTQKLRALFSKKLINNLVQGEVYMKKGRFGAKRPFFNAILYC
jgi:hypothetical protein